MTEIKAHAMIRTQRPSSTWTSVVTAMAMTGLLVTEVFAVDDETTAEQARLYDAAFQRVWQTEKRPYGHAIKLPTTNPRLAITAVQS